MLRVLKLLHVSDLASDLGIAKRHHRQKFGVRPSLSLIGLDHDMSLMCVCCWSIWRLRVADTFFYFLERLVALVRPQIYFSRTLEKLGRTCDQIGRTLEPYTMITILVPTPMCNDIMFKHSIYVVCHFKFSSSLNSGGFWLVESDSN